MVFCKSGQNPSHGFAMLDKTPPMVLQCWTKPPYGFADPDKNPPMVLQTLPWFCMYGRTLHGPLASHAGMMLCRAHHTLLMAYAASVVARIVIFSHWYFKNIKNRNISIAHEFRYIHLDKNPPMFFLFYFSFIKAISYYNALPLLSF